jgi:lysozyme
LTRAKRLSAGALGVCLIFVGGFEGLRQTAYRDVVGIPTICYGETKNVRMGQTATRAECDSMLVHSLVEHEDGMLKCLRVALPEKTQQAFLSFTYNVGAGAFCGSTLLRKANAGDIRGACDELLRWDKAGGVVFPGLTRRRLAERSMCLQGLN